jgi:hypothetical protein
MEPRYDTRKAEDRARILEAQLGVATSHVGHKGLVPESLSRIEQMVFHLKGITAVSRRLLMGDRGGGLVSSLNIPIPAAPTNTLNPGDPPSIAERLSEIEEVLASSLENARAIEEVLS